MKYYRLEYSIDLKEIGAFPQIQSGKYVSAWDAKHSLVLVHKKKVNDRLIEVPEVMLERKAKETDMVSSSILSFMLFISNKLKNLIEAKKYPGVQFFKTILHRKDGMGVEYWIVNPFLFRNEYIDFGHTPIERRSPYPETSSIIKVADKLEFERLFQDGRKIRTNHIIKTPSLYTEKINEDFFLLENVDGGVGYYVSESFKEEIMDAGCTGIRFSQIQ